MGLVMLRRKYCRDKIAEIDNKILRLNNRWQVQADAREHLLRLRRAYEIELEKAEKRKEPQIGFTEDGRGAKLEGYAVEGKQRNRGFFEEGFYNF